MRITRLAPLAAVALAVPLALSGCGSSGGTHSSAATQGGAGGGDIMLAAYTASTNARSADLSFTGTIDAAGHTVSLGGSGQLTFGSTPEASLRFTVPGVGSLQERLILPDVWVQAPAGERQALPVGKSWIEINLNTVLKSRFGASLSQLQGATQSPTETLSFLQQASNGVRKVGTATIGGVETTEYAADVDLTKAAAAKKSPQARAAVQKIEAEIHTSTLPVHVWIDSSDRVRQMTYSIAGSFDGQRFSTSFTMDLSHYGVPVHVTAPPASETVDISDVVSGTA